MYLLNKLFLCRKHVVPKHVLQERGGDIWSIGYWGIVILSRVKILPIFHTCFFTSYFGLEGNCSVSTSMCPWQMQSAVTLHPPQLTCILRPLATQNAHSRILGSVPTNSDFGARKRCLGSMQELRGVCINKLLLAHWADAIKFHNIPEVNFDAFKRSRDRY